jgi:hypothetical protein
MIWGLGGAWAGGPARRPGAARPQLGVPVLEAIYAVLEPWAVHNQPTGVEPTAARTNCEHSIVIGMLTQLRGRGGVAMATFVATQALTPGGTGRVWMKSVPLLSSHDCAGRVQLEG